jgi:hypothetical protein
VALVALLLAARWLAPRERAGAEQTGGN